MDGTYGWNIISDFFSSKIMDKLKLYMFGTEEHVLDISWNFLHFWMKCIFYTTPKTRPNPPWPNSEKIFFNGFIHFMKFPAFLVEVHFLPPSHPHQPNSEKLLRAGMLGSWINSLVFVNKVLKKCYHSCHGVSLFLLVYNSDISLVICKWSSSGRCNFLPKWYLPLPLVTV